MPTSTSQASSVPPGRLLMIDHYDSFTYNLVQYFGELGQDVMVRRHDQITLEDVDALQPTHICLSPGPGRPEQTGITLTLIQHVGHRIPILGVCLGHQAIAHAFGATIQPARRIMHGKVSSIKHSGKDVFAGLPSPMTVTRYHSLAVDAATLPDCLVVTAETENGEIMALRHRSLPISGVQFHPESILSEHGHALLKNFIEPSKDA